ncbi:protein of unknown function [Micropruina glycogenica]|uniref:Uncharacterized protein n=1 Tax=Micropruina glycogenica TaxID=75385 RepID=A0A2N9JF34_9ACTN|nr:protein of unknown function [Micropruina glycogenica]
MACRRRLRVRTPSGRARHVRAVRQGWAFDLTVPEQCSGRVRTIEAAHSPVESGGFRRSGPITPASVCKWLKQAARKAVTTETLEVRILPGARIHTPRSKKGRQR